MLCLTSPAVSVTAGGEVNQGCSTRPAPPVRRTIAHTNRGLHGHGKQYAQAVTACAPPPSRQQAGHPGNHLRAHSGTRGMPQGAPSGGQGGGGQGGGGQAAAAAAACCTVWPRHRGCPRPSFHGLRRDSAEGAAAQAQHSGGTDHRKQQARRVTGPRTRSICTTQAAGRHCAAGRHPRQSHRTGAAEGKRVGQWAPHFACVPRSWQGTGMWAHGAAHRPRWAECIPGRSYAGAHAAQGRRRRPARTPIGSGGEHGKGAAMRRRGTGRQGTRHTAQGAARKQKVAPETKWRQRYAGGRAAAP